MEERMGLRGHWTIEIREHGRLVKVLDFDNTLTDLYQASVLNQLVGNAYDDLCIDYLALGTDATASASTDTQLGAEVFRSVPTSKSLQTGYVQTIWVVTTEQANYNLKEIGVFAGSATITANSGTMLSRVNIDIEKTTSMELTFIRKDYVSIN